MYHRGPVALAGQRVGLLGGSFDPPHPGHAHISRWALRAALLDQVWWLVSPGNPLKARGPAEIDRRVSAARAMIHHPKITVTDIERCMASRYTADTLAWLRHRYPGVRFVWLMGADNLASFHHWDRWDWIIETTPMIIFARPGQQLAAGLSPTARRYARLRVEPCDAPALGSTLARGWCLLTGPMSDLSSTAIRRRGAWP
ncbi:MAG: nicotinate-nucleotide adenylyltransferase [Pseudomonadota bacterium]